MLEGINMPSRLPVMNRSSPIVRNCDRRVTLSRLIFRINFELVTVVRGPAGMWMVVSKVYDYTTYWYWYQSLKIQTVATRTISSILLTWDTMIGDYVMFTYHLFIFSIHSWNIPFYRLFISYIPFMDPRFSLRTFYIPFIFLRFLLWTLHSLKYLCKTWST